MSGPPDLKHNPNQWLAGLLLEQFAGSGLVHACVSPGSRSAPMALALAREPRVRKWVIPDERSAGFFALGLARRHRVPVLLLCSSGTAAANYLPAVVEASLSKQPLLVVTADRPPELRDWRAPQTIDQPGLFGSHVRWSLDLPLSGGELEHYYRAVAARAWATASAVPAGPVHLNLPAREPLIDVPQGRLSSTSVAASSSLGSGGRDAAAHKEDGSGRDGGLRDEDGDRCDADAHKEDGDRSGTGARKEDGSGRSEEACDEDAFGETLEGSAAGLERTVITSIINGIRLLTNQKLEDVVARFGAFSRGLLVCGPDALAVTERDALMAFARALQWPVIADPLSGLRFGAHDRSMLVDAYDALLRDRELSAELSAEAVIQVGALPASKALHDYLGKQRSSHYVVVSGDDWPDPLHLAREFLRVDPGEFFRCASQRLEAADSSARPATRPVSSAWASRWLKASACTRESLDEALEAEGSLFEGKVFRELLKHLPEGAALCVANSMPVRDADTFLGSSSRKLDFFANRGANGIDGVVSTALGIAATGGPAALVIGDLSFLHDIGALQAAARFGIDLLIVVVNNDGGGIFSFLPQASLGAEFEEYFATPHGLDIEALASPLCRAYTVIRSWAEFSTAVRAAFELGGLHVVELPGSREDNESAHRRYLDRASAVLRLGVTG